MKFKNSDKICFKNDSLLIGPVLDRKEMKLKFYKVFLVNIDKREFEQIKKCSNYRELKKYKKNISYVFHVDKYDEIPDEEELIDDLNLIKKIRSVHEKYLQVLGFNDDLELNNYQKFLEQIYKRKEQRNMEFANKMLDTLF